MQLDIDLHRNAVLSDFVGHLLFLLWLGFFLFRCDDDDDDEYEHHDEYISSENHGEWQFHIGVLRAFPMAANASEDRQTDDRAKQSFQGGDKL